MSEEPTESGPTLAIFADAASPGDADYPRLLSTAGTLLANAGVQIVCLSENGTYCRPLVIAARAGGAAVTILSDGSLKTADFAAGCSIEVLPEADLRFQRMSEMADAFIGFPAGIVSVRALFNVWVLAGGGSSGKPVALLNRNRAYEVLRGYAMDVLSHSLTNSDRLVIFADTVEDLWNRLERALARG